MSNSPTMRRAEKRKCAIVAAALLLSVGVEGGGSFSTRNVAAFGLGRREALQRASTAIVGGVSFVGTTVAPAFANDDEGKEEASLSPLAPLTTSDDKRTSAVLPQEPMLVTEIVDDHKKETPVDGSHDVSSR